MTKQFLNKSYFHYLIKSQNTADCYSRTSALATAGFMLQGTFLTRLKCCLYVGTLAIYSITLTLCKMSIFRYSLQFNVPIPCRIESIQSHRYVFTTTYNPTRLLPMPFRHKINHIALTFQRHFELSLFRIYVICTLFICFQT